MSLAAADLTLERPRLAVALDRPDARLTVLTAPSGFGKTTLVRSWMVQLPQRDARAVWIPVGRENLTRHIFWQNVAAACGRLQRVSGANEVVDAIEADDDPALVLADFLQRTSVRTLVLDAYENLGDLTARVDDDIRCIIDRAPDLHVVITTRARTSLTDAATALGHGVVILGERALTFTEEETAAFWGSEHSVSAADVQRQTKGYPLAIRALRIARERHDTLPDFDGEHWRSYVVDYLREQLNRDGAHEFVLDTCLAPYVDRRLATELGGTEAEGILAALEHNGFGRWIPYAPQRSVFQYIELVRDSYVAELRRGDPRRFGDQASATAQWLHANGEHEAAFLLALDAQQFPMAETIFRDLSVVRPESYTTNALAAHLSRLPRTTLIDHPDLAFALGLVLINSSATRGAAPPVLRAVVDHGTVDRRDSASTATFRLVARTISQRVLLDFREAAETAVRGATYLEELPIQTLDGLEELVPTAMRHFAYSLFQYGQVDESRHFANRAAALARTPTSRNFTIVYGLGINAFDGRLREAAATAELIDADAWPRGTAFSYVNAMGRIGQGAILLDAFDFERAIREFDHCESFLDTSEFWPFINWVLANARLGLGDAASEALRLSSALRAQPSAPGTGDNLGNAALHNALSIAWLAAGQPNRAQDAIRTSMRCAGQMAPAAVLMHLVSGQAERGVKEVTRLESLRGHTVRSMSATLTLTAAAALRTGARDIAMGLLRRAAVLFEAHGVRAHLIYVPESDLADLRTLAAEQGERGSQSYLAAPVPGLVGIASVSVPVVALTKRERIVLNTLGKYRTRSEIADALHVSEATVKSQLGSIYRKLGATTRQEAFERAVELNLLESDPSGA